MAVSDHRRRVAGLRAAEANLQCDEARAALAGFARAGVFSRLGARRTAGVVLAQARATVEPEADPTGSDVRAAEALGMTHLLAAQRAGRNGHSGDADTHLAEAADLAHTTVERRRSRLHLDLARGYAQAEGTGTAR